MSACRTPNGLSASMIALTTAGGDPTVADSPMPLHPSGWGGDGGFVSPNSDDGTPSGVGSREAKYDPPRDGPVSSEAVNSLNALPIPSGRPPWICPSTIIGLMRGPQSSTAMNRRTFVWPVPGSMSTTAMYAPNGYVRFGGL